MEIYKLKDFAKWAKKEGISDNDLAAVVIEMSRGLLGDRLGSCIYKKRIKVEGRGKRGGARAIILFRDNEVTLFLHGYLKNDRADISINEEMQLRLFAGEFMQLSAAERARVKAKGKLLVVES